jgi:hypothetical protein
MDLDVMFNDVDDLESNMRASWKQRKSRYDPLRGENTLIGGRGKTSKVHLLVKSL